jgi:hypothetical protein
MRAHDCDQECPCGHWKPRTASRYYVPATTRGRITLDVLDEAPDHDANYGDYEPEER